MTFKYFTMVFKYFADGESNLHPQKREVKFIIGGVVKSAKSKGRKPEGFAICDLRILIKSTIENLKLKILLMPIA